MRETFPRRRNITMWCKANKMEEMHLCLNVTERRKRMNERPLIGLATHVTHVAGLVLCVPPDLRLMPPSWLPLSLPQHLNRKEFYALDNYASFTLWRDSRPCHRVVNKPEEEKCTRRDSHGKKYKLLFIKGHVCGGRVLSFQLIFYTHLCPSK